METTHRRLGIEAWGDIAWGTHFCLFYETEQDLLEILSLYFKPGLASHEYCLWITPEPSNQKALDALRQVIPSIDQHLEEGDIEIISCRDWYCESNKFDAARILHEFDAKLSWALEKGYKRMRVMGDEAWLDQAQWKEFSDYERRLDQQLAGKPVNILCAYPTASQSATDVLDVARIHDFIAAKRNGDWEILEGPKMKHVKAESDRFGTKFGARETEEKAQDSSRGLNQSFIFRYGLPVLAVALSLAGTILLQPYIFRTPLFFLSIMISTWIGGIGPGLLAVLLSTLGMNLFLSPAGLLETPFQNIPNVLAFLITALLVASWSEARRRAEYALRKARDGLELKVQERTADLRRVNQALRAEITDQKRTEEALRTSEYRLQAAIDAADIVLWERDLSSGHITWLGHHERLLGFAPGELNDNTLASFENRVHPEDIEELRKVRQRALEERSEYHHEYRVVWRDGSIHWLRAQGRFIYNEAGQPVRLYGAVLDITERKQAEEARRKSEENYRRIIETAQEGIIAFDENWRVSFANAWIAGFLGYDQGEMLGMHIDEFVFDEDRSDHERRKALREQGISGTREGIYRTKSGAPFWMLLSSTPIFEEGRFAGAFIMATNITERKRAEEALRKGERVLREAEVLGHTGSWEQDLVTGEIFNTEENLRLFFGDDRSKGASFEDYSQVVHPDDREYVMRRRAELLEEEGPSDIEYRVVWPDGSVHMIFGRATVVRDELGQPIRVYGTNVDITERQQAEEQIRHYAARMEALAEISRTFVETGLDYQSLLNTVARRTAEVIGDSCVITLFSDDAQRSFPVAFHHHNPEALSMMHEALMHTWQGGTDTQRYQSLLAGNTIFIPSVNPEEFQASLEPEFRTFFEVVGISSVLIVPLKTDGRVIGTLGVTRDRQGSPYTRDDLTLLQNIADRAAMSIQNAQLFSQVQGARERLEALSRRLLEVQETERRALTTELHDRVGQNLTALSITLQNMKALLSDEEAQMLETKFDDTQAMVEDTTRQIRDIMAELHLPELEDYGLAAALETYAERAASRGNLELIADLQDLAPPRLPSEVRIALFRAAQEAISNILKHANATQLEVSLHRENGTVRLTVEDDGQGFDPGAASQKETPSWGLKIMRERIESIGGKVQVESEPGQGTRVTFEVERPT